MVRLDNKVRKGKFFQLILLKKVQNNRKRSVKTSLPNQGTQRKITHYIVNTLRDDDKVDTCSHLYHLLEIMDT